VTIPTGEPGAGSYLVTWNGHGDVLALSEIDPVNGTLTRANRFSYSTWGTPTLAIETGYGDLGFRYRYVGRYGVAWDGYAGAGLLYMRARHYSPEFGRFLQPDPAAAEANLYAYTENSPVTKADPSGMESGVLTDAEKAICARPGNWLRCLEVRADGYWAQRETIRRFGHDVDGTRANAFKHCAWAAACTITTGWVFAKRILDAHETENGEVKPDLNDRNHKMDVHNNNWGQTFALRYRTTTYGRGGAAGLRHVLQRLSAVCYVASWTGLLSRLR
jgi:RHS repeat-associated protein